MRLLAAVARLVRAPPTRASPHPPAHGPPDLQALRTIYDPYNDEEVTLSKEELAMVMRIRAGQFPHLEVNPHETEHTWFTDPRDAEVMPIVDRPEPKSRFVPSKWEEQK